MATHRSDKCLGRVANICSALIDGFFEPEIPDDSEGHDEKAYHNQGGPEYSPERGADNVAECRAGN